LNDTSTVMLYGMGFALFAGRLEAPHAHGFDRLRAQVFSCPFVSFAFIRG
jgi:hypothetical protein